MRMKQTNKQRERTEFEDEKCQTVREKKTNQQLTDQWTIRERDRRKDDFLPHSDFDFIVFPSNEESIPYAKVLQEEITQALKAASLKTDDHLAGIYNFQIKLKNIPEELLVTEKGIFEPEFQATWGRPCIASRALRDLEFVNGNQSAFERLQEIINPVLYPFSNGSVNCKLKSLGSIPIA